MALSLTNTPTVVYGATQPDPAEITVLLDELIGGIDQNETDIEAAVDLARAINNTWVTLFADGGTIDWDDTANTVTFPRLRREQSGASSVNGATSQGPFNVSTTNDTFYYVMDDAGVITQESALLSGTDESGTAKKIAASSYGVLRTHWTLPDPVRASDVAAETARAAAIEARPSVEPITAQEQVFYTQNSNPMMLSHFSDVYEISGTKHFIVDPPIDGMAYEVPDGGNVYLNVHPGRTAVLSSTGSFTLYAGDGKKFSGGSANDNQCAITKPTNGSAVVRISRDAGSRMNVESLSVGTTTTFSTVSEPTVDEHVFVFGQSHGNSLFNSGLEGFHKAIDSGVFAITDSFVNFSNGSVGGTGVAYPDGASFWDTTNDQPGTLLNTAMADLDAKTTTDGWPRASAFIFECGDADRAAFSSDEMTVAELAAVVGDVLDEVRSHCAAGAICIMGIYGSARFTDPDTGTTSDTSATASREAYLLAASTRSWVHLVEVKGVRGRELHDVHMNSVASYRHMYEIGCVFARAVHSDTTEQYTTVTSAVKQSTRVVRVTFDPPSGQELVMPLAKFNGKQYGKYPFGLGLIGSGGNASTNSLTIEYAEIHSGTEIDLTVIDGEDVTGATLITHAGRLQDAMFGNFVRDDFVGPTAGRGVRPALVSVT
jgi:hypothetical protein